MGCHSIFFVNQIEGRDILDSSTVQNSPGLRNNRDECYQCLLQGPDVYPKLPNIWRSSTGATVASTGREDQRRFFIRLNIEPLLAHEVIESCLSQNSVRQRHYLSHPMFRPFPFHTYDMASQTIVFVQNHARVNVNDPSLQNLYAVHYPSCYDQERVKVAYLDKKNQQDDAIRQGERGPI